MPRPRNIGIFDLMRYRFPIMAISSILHRITGVLLVIYVPFLLYYFHLSLQGASGFYAVKMMLSQSCGKFFLWVFLSAFFYHVWAGIKHLVMDMGHAESLKAAKIFSSLVLVLGVVGAILLGVWVW